MLWLSGEDQPKRVLCVWKCVWPVPMMIVCDVISYMMPPMAKEGMLCSSGAGCVGLIPANSYAQHMPSSSCWQFEMKPSPFWQCRIQDCIQYVWYLWVHILKMVAVNVEGIAPCIGSSVQELEFPLMPPSLSVWRWPQEPHTMLLMKMELSLAAVHLTSTCTWSVWGEETLV